MELDQTKHVSDHHYLGPSSIWGKQWA